MGRCSRCGARKPESRVHKWCAKCLWDYKHERCRMAELANSTSSNDDLRATLETFTYPPDIGGGELLDESTGVEPVLKRCGTCKNYKPLEEFNRDASRRDERHISCKGCRTRARKKRKEDGGEDEEEDEAVAQNEEELPQKRG